MITIHPALFEQADWQQAIDTLEAETGRVATIGNPYATLQPMRATAATLPRNANETAQQQEQRA